MNKSKILIVNDREENLVALEQLLCDLDVEIVRALSGNEAISKTLESEFVIALLDVQMPEMDGFETLKLLRKNKQTKNLPVIFITTTYHDEYSKIKGIERGAVDFLIKPIVPELLLGKIRVFLNLYHQRIKLSNTIAERDKALEELGSYRDHLEEIVAKRTNELEELNNGLEKKIEVFKKTEKTLKENEALLRKMAENYPNSFISIIKSDLTIGFTAGQEFKKNNLDPEKFIGIKIEQVFGENTPIVKKHYLKSFKGKET